MSTKTQIEAIGRAADFNDAVAALREVELQRLAPSQFTQIDRYLDRLGSDHHLKIAYLGNFVLDLLPSYVGVTSAKYGLRCASYIGAYNQYYQEVLDPSAGLHPAEPDLVFLFLTMKQLEPDIAHRFASLKEERKRELMDKIIVHISDWINLAADRLKAILVVSNFPFPAYLQNGLADQTDPLGEMQFHMELNNRLAEICAQSPSVQLFDLAKLTARFGADNVFDPKLYYLAKMIWSERFLPVVADETLRIIIAVRGMSKKCLVLDLDNTLWSGVVGEDGPRGVKVGVGDAVSEAFFDLQMRFKTLKDRGIMLAICSKNNEDDVRELFDMRTDMPLRIEDFAAMRINWENKAVNIREISKELNIGLDSMVFIDDNPAECALVREMLPEVMTLQLPAQPEALPGLIDHLPVFEKRVILDADRQKTNQYLQNRQRQQLQEQVADLGAYLHSIETEIVVRRPHKEDLDRVHQLFTKTNQFNLTTIRYTPSNIDSFFNSDNCEIFITSAKDKFGDLGIISLYLVRADHDDATVDSFIMSCRAMGRGIESAIMNHLKKCCFEHRQVKSIEACYIPTKKNIPVASFLDEQGFQLDRVDESGKKHYRLAAKTSRLIECPWIKIRQQEK
jgi:FkbH-like protein